MTINNLGNIFTNLKAGNPPFNVSCFSCIPEEIVKQHGDVEVHPGWVCMRRESLFCDLDKYGFKQMQKFAWEKGAEPCALLPRILFNFLSVVRSKGRSEYPDGRIMFAGNDFQIVWTSTPTICSDPMPHLSGVSCSFRTGLRVVHCDGYSPLDGFSVQLAEEVLASGNFSLRLSNFVKLFTEDEQRQILSVVDKNKQAIAMCSSGNLYEAKKLFKSCLDLCMDCADLNLQNKTRVVIHKNLSIVWQAAGKLEKAEAELKEALQLASDRLSKITLNIALMHILHGQGKIDAANQLYLEILSKYNIDQSVLEASLDSYQTDLDLFSQFSAVSERYHNLIKFCVKLNIPKQTKIYMKKAMQNEAITQVVKEKIAQEEQVIPDLPVDFFEPRYFPFTPDVYATSFYNFQRAGSSSAV